MGYLSREQILDALDRLAQELGSSGGPVNLFVVGGAALVLLYNARSATKDVDAVILGKEDRSDVRRAALAVARQLELPEDWLNEGAKGYLHGLDPGEILLSRRSLVVQSVSPAQLLAMKLSAWRDDLDIDDARLLLTKLHGERKVVWAAVEPFLVPGRELKAQYAFADLWEAEHEAD